MKRASNSSFFLYLFAGAILLTPAITHAAWCTQVQGIIEWQLRCDFATQEACFAYCGDPANPDCNPLLNPQCYQEGTDPRTLPTTPEPSPSEPSPSTYEFSPLQPITLPGGEDLYNESSSLGETLNRIVRVLIGVAGILAVAMFVYGAFRYATTDAVSGKEEGKGIIKQALLGLLLALTSVVILNTINPDILDLNVLKPIVIPTGTAGEWEAGEVVATEEGMGNTITTVYGVNGNCVNLQRLLDEGKISITSSQDREASPRGKSVRGGHSTHPASEHGEINLHPKFCPTLIAIANAGFRINISAITYNHRKNTSSGVVSHHYNGAGLDINLINGVGDEHGQRRFDEEGERLQAFLFHNRNILGIRELFGPVNTRELILSRCNPTTMNSGLAGPHKNHVHIAFGC